VPKDGIIQQNKVLSKQYFFLAIGSKDPSGNFSFQFGNYAME
jgi:hypothetical protein